MGFLLNTFTTDCQRHTAEMVINSWFEVVRPVRNHINLYVCIDDRAVWVNLGEGANFRGPQVI